MQFFGGPPPKSDGAAAKPAASSASSSISELPNDHSFVWDADLVKELDQAGARVPRGAGDKQANKKVAQENYRLCAEGGYQDIHGKFHMLQLPKGAINTTHRAPRSPGVPTAPRHKETRVAVARVDTATATRDLKQLGYGRVAALNFANAFHPGGGYVNGARAQEEDLCRLIPTLFGSLKKLKYPIKEYEAHYTQGWLARSAGTYSLDDEPLLVDIVSSAMPDLGSAWNKIRLDSEEWHQTVRTRMRAVLHAAKEEHAEAVVLGAFGCGAFLNPPEAVAPLMVDVIRSDEFRGAFRCVVFAILVNHDRESANFNHFKLACQDGKTGGLCTPHDQQRRAPVGAAAASGAGRAGGANGSGAAAGAGARDGANGSGSSAADPMELG